VVANLEAELVGSRSWKIGKGNNFDGISIADSEQLTTSNGIRMVKKGILAQEDRDPQVIFLEDKQVEKQKNEPLKDIFKHFARLGALTAVIAISAEGAIVAGSVADNNNTMQRADVSTATYLLQNQKDWQRASIGFSFAPEDLGLWIGNYKTKAGKQLTQQDLGELDSLHKDTLMDDVRFAFEWPNLYNSQGKFDFGFYKPYFDEMVKNQMRITIDVGPKTLGYKEYKQPKIMGSKLLTPPADNSIIYSSDEIGQQSIVSLNELFSYLHANYTVVQLAYIVGVQVGNENDNNFGDPATRLSQEFQLKLIKIAHAAFPGRKILLNSAGQLNLESTSDTIKKAQDEDPSLKGEMDEGVDYHLDVGSVNLPFVGKADPFNVPGAGEIDSVVVDRVDPIDGDEFAKTIEDAAANDYGIETTEFGVIKPWNNGDYSKGNRVLKLKYGLLRLMDHVLPKSGKVVIRLWGSQNWFADLRAGGVRATEAKEMEELVKDINTISADSLYVSS
jgi:hypothetical protein